MTRLAFIFGLLLALLLALSPMAVHAQNAIRIPHRKAAGICPHGAQLDQRIMVGTEERAYLLYIPKTWDCTTPLPLFVDLHGAALGIDRPEENYAFNEMTDFANRRGALVIRPRSRFVVRNNRKNFSWDFQGQSELTRNVAFINKLVADVRTRFAVDQKQIFVMGFSNGANLSAQFLAATPQVFSAFGVIGGGLLNDPGPLSVDRMRSHVYIATGSKDSSTPRRWSLLSYLSRSLFPPANLLDRRTSSGRKLEGWQYFDFANWAQGRLLPTVRVPSNWTVLTLPGAKAILDITKDGVGFLYASTENGQIWKRAHDGKWNLIFQAQQPVPFTGLCVLGSNVVVAGGANVLVTSDGDQKNWRARSLDQTTAWINSLTCGKTHFYVASFPFGYLGTDLDHLLPTRGANAPNGVDIFAAAASEDGRLLTVGGRGTLGFSIDSGQSMRFGYSATVDNHWFYDVTFQKGFWAAGEDGLIGYFDQNANLRIFETGVRDLYSIKMTSQNLGVAAGLLGSVIVTRDGGHSWRDISITAPFSLTATEIDTNNLVVLGDENGHIYYVRPPLWPAIKTDAAELKK